MPALYSLIVKPGEKAPFVPPPNGETWYLRHVALAAAGSIGDNAVLTFATSEGPPITLGVLSPDRLNYMSLDLPISEYVEFFVKGTMEVHLTGTLVSEEGSMDLDIDEDDEEELEALREAMNGGGRIMLKSLEDSEEESSEDEEPQPLVQIEEITETEKEKKSLSGKAKKGAEEKEPEKDQPELSKSAKKRLKRKQRKEAQAALVSGSGEESPSKQQRMEAPEAKPEKQDSASPKAADKQSSESSKMADARKRKKIRRFSNGFVIENLSYGPDEGLAVESGRKVSIKYEGRLKDGQVFDESKNKPFSFVYGKGDVIKGLDKGLDDMRVGDKRRLTVPPKMGYGAEGVSPSVPPNSELFFDIEVVKIE